MMRVNMCATALWRILNAAVDSESFEKGRSDVRQAVKGADPAKIEALRQDVKRRLESGNFKRAATPSYWIGCMSEFDFI